MIAVLQRWRELGYALDEEELREGMVCIGVALARPETGTSCGLAVSLTAKEAARLDLTPRLVPCTAQEKAPLH